MKNLAAPTQLISSERRTSAIILLLISAAILPYLKTLTAGFVWDDYQFILNNSLMHDSHGLWKIWTTHAAPDFWPLSYSAFWAEWQLFGNEPLGYHLVNLLLHATNVLLFWGILHRLGVRAAWLAGLLFAVHPIATEVVAWSFQLKTLLATCLAFFSLWAYLKAESARGYVAAYGLFAAAMLCKTSVIFWPLVVGAVDLWHRRAPMGKTAARVWPFFALAVPLGAMAALWYSPAMVADLGPSPGIFDKLALAGQLGWFYLAKLLVPANLCLVYAKWDPWRFSWLGILPLFLMVGLLLFLGSRRHRACRGLGFGLAYYLVSLAPALGLFRPYFMRYSFVADHYQYLAMVGPFAAFADLSAFKLAAWRWRFAASVLVVALALMTTKQTSVFANDEALWTKTLEVNPTAALALNNLGKIRETQQQQAEASRLYAAAVAADPNYREALNNLGVSLLREGQPLLAVARFKEALAIRGDYASAWSNLGSAYLTLRQLDEAKDCLTRAIELQPEFEAAHLSLGAFYEMTGQLEASLAEFRYASALDESAAGLQRGAMVALKLGRYNQASEAARQALTRHPGDPLARTILAEIGLELRESNAKDRMLALWLDVRDCLTCLLRGARALAVIGDNNSAAQWYKRAEAIDPHNSEIQTILDQLRARQ